MKKLIGILLWLMACSEQASKTTQTNSARFSTQQEKLQFLATYLTRHSAIRDAEYTIWYQDNSSGMISGPSDYTMAIALQINKDSIDYWLNGLKKENFTINRSLWKEVPLNKANWKGSGKQEVFTGVGETKAVYREAGIILAHYTSIPTDIERYKE